MTPSRFNPGSVGLHEAMGFRPVGTYRSVGYKLGAWHDVGWWHLELQHTRGEPAPPALGFLFLGSPQKLPCDSAADADDSGKLAITDAIYLLSYLFTGGTAPPPPFGACGVDATPDGLPCDVFAPCG